MQGIGFFELWRKVNGELPNSFLVFDIETNDKFLGSPDMRVVQVGLLPVIDCIPQDVISVYIDYGEPVIPYGRSELTGISDELLHSSGVPPDEAFHKIWSLFSVFREAHNAAYLGYNVLQFDRPCLECSFSKYAGLDVRFPKNSIIDVGAIYKASLMRANSRGIWKTDTDPDTWSKRILRTRRRIKWSLFDACVPNLGIDLEKLAAEGSSHSADYDCIVTYEAWKKLREKYDDRSSG